MSKNIMRCYDIEGQTAIVTGTSSGLGVCFAEALAECGVNLVIAARRNEKLVKVAEDLLGNMVSKWFLFKRMYLKKIKS